MPCRPILPWISWAEKPGVAVGTRKQASPRCFCSGSVWAKIIATLGVVAQRDPHLVAAEHPAVVGLARPRLLVGGVGAGVGLGQAEAAEPLARAQLGQVSALLLLGAPAQDRRADQRGLHRDRPCASPSSRGRSPRPRSRRSRSPGRRRRTPRARSRRGSPGRRSCATSSVSKWWLRSFSRARGDDLVVGERRARSRGSAAARR